MREKPRRCGQSKTARRSFAQTQDGYLWFGTEFGLVRFDGVRSTPWQPPAGEHLPNNINALLVTRDGTLWIGTFAGLATWSGGKLTPRPELGEVSGDHSLLFA
jgi:ligand-binding sensor domain-containing protein